MRGKRSAKDKHLRQLTERDKREYTSRSTAGSYADGASLLSDGAGSESTASADSSRPNRRGVWPPILPKRVLAVMGKTEHCVKSARRLRQYW